MKNTYILFLLFLTTTSFGQNWAPFSQGNKHLYSSNLTTTLPNSNLQSPIPESGKKLFTIWIDSTQVDGNDSIFYFNRVANIDMFNPEILTTNDDAFLGFKMIKSDSLNDYSFEDKDGNFLFRINPHAGLNDTWDFNNNTIATITDVAEEFLISEVDSVKLIELSTGEGIYISKNNGIISIPFFENNEEAFKVGTVGSAFGIQQSTFDDYFNFNVGDVFQHRSENNFPQNNPPIPYDKREAVRKKTVLSKTVFPDSIVYEFFLETRVTKYEWNIVMGEPIGYKVKSTSYNEGNITETYRKENHITNSDPLEMVAPYLSFDVPFHWIWVHYDPAFLWSSLEAYIDNDANIIKKIGRGWGAPMFALCPDGTFCLGALLGSLVRYDEGLGLTDYYESDFESGDYHYYLEGYAKGTDTVGMVYNDIDFLIDTDDVVMDNNAFQVFPNPVEDVLNISFSKNLESPTRLEIFDNLGQLILTHTVQPFQNQVTINISDVARGVYYLNLENEEWRGIKKVIK